MPARFKRSAMPIENVALWGLDPDAVVNQACSLQEGGVCPPGCEECIRFEREMEVTPALPVIPYVDPWGSEDRFS